MDAQYDSKTLSQLFITYSVQYTITTFPGLQKKPRRCHRLTHAAVSTCAVYCQATSKVSNLVSRQVEQQTILNPPSGIYCTIFSPRLCTTTFSRDSFNLAQAETAVGAHLSAFSVMIVVYTCPPPIYCTKKGDQKISSAAKLLFVVACSNRSACSNGCKNRQTTGLVLVDRPYT